MTKLFAISYMAWNFVPGSAEQIDMFHGAALMACDSPDEAHQHYMDKALELWPPDEGWRGHDVVIGEFAAHTVVLAGTVQVTLQSQGKADIGREESITIEASPLEM